MVQYQLQDDERRRKAGVGCLAKRAIEHSSILSSLALSILTESANDVDQKRGAVIDRMSQCDVGNVDTASKLNGVYTRLRPILVRRTNRYQGRRPPGILKVECRYCIAPLYAVWL